jgi:Fe-Mn family superoxide dismutase
MLKFFQLLFLIFTTFAYAETQSLSPFQYKAKKFDYLLGMEGLTDELLKEHFELYRGYVNQTNLINQKLSELLNSNKMSAYEYSALKKAYAFEYNGMKLHELYFENISKMRQKNDGLSITAKLNSDFGSYELWEKDFIQTGLTRGIGWVICYFDKTSGKIINSWISSHELGVPIYNNIIIIMDCWEHAYLKDYGIKRVDYLNNFVSHINWKVAEARLQNADK